MAKEGQHPLLLAPLVKGVGCWGRVFTTPLFILLAACFLCYINTLSCGFVFDDISAIKDNKVDWLLYWIYVLEAVSLIGIRIIWIGNILPDSDPTSR
jgi:hypothetical protein